MNLLKIIYQKQIKPVNITQQTTQSTPAPTSNPESTTSADISNWKTLLAISFCIFIVGYSIKVYTKYMIRNPFMVATDTVPKGDFFAAFPGPHVEKYNPDLLKNNYKKGIYFVNIYDNGLLIKNQKLIKH